MLSSFENGKPNLYMIDPSGVSYVSQIILYALYMISKCLLVVYVTEKMNQLQTCIDHYHLSVSLINLYFGTSHYFVIEFE